jgi:hypothetical protein
MKLISGRSSLYALKVAIAKIILDELTDQKNQLEALTTKTAFQTYYLSVLEKYFVEDDDGDEVLNLFVDRYNKPDIAELPLINLVVEGDENNDNGTVQHTNTEINFEIEVYDVASGEGESDEDANDKVEFMTGIIRNILETSTLSGIQHKRVMRRKFNYRPSEESLNATYSSVVLFVKYIEDVFIKSDHVKVSTNYTKLRGRFSLKTDNLEV